MKKLTLTENDLLARGNDRYVFQHPHNHQLLIKVVIPSIPKYKSKLREVYRDVKECKPRDETDSLFIQKIEGLVETDKGIGQVIVKEHDQQGNIARTLYDLAKHNELDAEKFSKLNAFLAWFYSYRRHYQLAALQKYCLCLGRCSSGVPLQSY